MRAAQVSERAMQRLSDGSRRSSLARLQRTYTTTLSPHVQRVTKRCATLRALWWFSLVLLVGGGAFSLLERDAEVESRRNLADFLRRMHAALDEESFHELVSVLGRVEDRVAEEMVRANISSAALPDVLAPHDWDFVGACFFCFTAATTIGYGNYTPQVRTNKRSGII